MYRNIPPLGKQSETRSALQLTPVDFRAALQGAEIE